MREVPSAPLPDAAGVDQYEARDTADLVLRVLRVLPARQRVVIVLRYWVELSEEQIAAPLGCSPGTVKSRASRALASLRTGPLAELLDGTRATR